MVWTLVIIAIILFVVLPLLGLALGTVISAAVTGLIIGALARLVVPNTRGMGILPTILLGLVGSIVGGFIGDAVFDTNRVVTVLIEIAVAAVAIALFSSHRRREIAGR